MLVLSAKCNWADHIPYCLEPSKFPVTMETTSATIDVARYMGTWYEFARMPDQFEKGCVCSTAEYKLNTEGGFVEVHNSCVKHGGEVIDVRGKAYSENVTNSKLNVYFNALFPAAYWVLDIDVNYQWVVVGEPCKNFGYILARSRTMPEAILQSKVALLKSKGYNTDLIQLRPATC